jgi:hypothetical protein
LESGAQHPRVEHLAEIALLREQPTEVPDVAADDFVFSTVVIPDEGGWGSRRKSGPR